MKLEDVSVRYGERPLLDRLNWEIRPGERWALLGPNGAGKSTVLSLLNSDNPQVYSQKITLFDRRRDTGESIWDLKRRIGHASPELLQYFPGAPTCLQVVASGFAASLRAGPKRGGRAGPARGSGATPWHRQRAASASRGISRFFIRGFACWAATPAQLSRPGCVALPSIPIPGAVSESVHSLSAAGGRLFGPAGRSSGAPLVLLKSGQPAQEPAAREYSCILT